MKNYAELPFEAKEIDRKELTINNAIKFAHIIAKESLPYVHYIKCLRSTSEPLEEIVIFDLEVERPQDVKYDIRNKERIGVIFSNSKISIPETLALRSDFPQAPHLNLRKYEIPKNLCLFNEDASEVMRRWTPLMFIEQIRQWLKLTAKGTLHQEDQPLEPIMLYSAGTIILNDGIDGRITEEVIVPIDVCCISDIKDPHKVLTTQSKGSNAESKNIQFVATGYISEPTTHGIVRSLPRTIAELSKMVEECGLCLIEELRKTLKAWDADKKNVANIKGSHLIIIIVFQKTRIDGGLVEDKERWAFLCEGTLSEVGADLGVWESRGGEDGLLLKIDNEKKGENITVFPLKTVCSFSREIAANLSNIKFTENDEIALVGVGAMGSHFLLNTVRGGIGRWSIIDDDILLPHNLARHALDGHWIGHYKADSLSIIINRMFDMADEIPVAIPLVANVLSPGKNLQLLESTFHKASVIVDASASVGVARQITLDTCSEARRLSIFFTPSGKASVFLSEDKKRLCPLDILEMQYYRTVVTLDCLKDHLTADGQFIRYAQSCRDLTSLIPQDLVALHASIAAGAFKKVIQNTDAFGGIWTIDPNNSGVNFTPVQPMPVIKIDGGDWQVRTDEAFISKLLRSRAEKLPNETGGVIIGSYDMQRQIIYLVDTILSPPDSEEWPALYIRGCKGLLPEIERIEKLTAGNLVYVGEWHSHPDGVKTNPSTADMEAFIWLSNHMKADGLPPLMVIVGEHHSPSVYVGKMIDR